MFPARATAAFLTNRLRIAGLCPKGFRERARERGVMLF